MGRNCPQCAKSAPGDHVNQKPTAPISLPLLITTQHPPLTAVPFNVWPASHAPTTLPILQTRHEIEQSLNPYTDIQHGLGYGHTDLRGLRSCFIPGFLARSGDKDCLFKLMRDSVQQWTGLSLRLRVSIVWKQMPMKLELHEFVPRSTEVSTYFQNTVDQSISKRRWLSKPSPNLASCRIDCANCFAYLNDIVDNPTNLKSFVKRCYGFEKNDFQQKLLGIILSHQPQTNDEVSDQIPSSWYHGSNTRPQEDGAP